MTIRVSICLVAIMATWGLFAIDSAHADARLGAALNATVPIEKFVTKVGYDRGYRQGYGHHARNDGYDELEGYYHKKRYFYHKKRAFIYEQRYKFHERRKDFHKEKYKENKWTSSSWGSWGRKHHRGYKDYGGPRYRVGHDYRRYDRGNHYSYRHYPRYRKPKRYYFGMRYDRQYETYSYGSPQIYTYAPTYCGGC